jgi:hypothetical protein
MEPRAKYHIKIRFMKDPKTGESAPLKDMSLDTKPVTEKRANELAEEHADSVWLWWEYSMKRLDRQ